MKEKSNARVWSWKMLDGWIKEARLKGSRLRGRISARESGQTAALSY